MTNRIPLIVNAGVAQIQEVSASDVLTVPGTVSANVVQTDNYQYANGQPFAGGGGNYGNSNVATFLADFGSNTISTTGDVTANAFVGDGSQLTNLPLATNSTVGVVALGNGFTLNSSNQVTTSSLYNTNLTQPTQHYALRVDTNGVVILPDQSIINGSTLRAVAGSYAGLTTDDGENSWMWVDSTGAYIATQYNESGNSHQWTFDNTGNLTLPSDGGAGAASVTINFAGVGYTTETNVPTNALTGTGSGMTVDIVASLSGSNPITNVTINQAGTGYAPGDSIQVAQSSSTGNGTLTVVSVNPVTVPSINYANGQPYGSSANTGNVTFNDINIIGTGNLHLQPDPSNTGSYLDIFLTSGPDLHLVTSASANLILGKDDQANVMTSWNGNVYVQSWNLNTATPNTWTFGGDGSTIFPTLTTQRGDNPSGTIQGQTLLFGDAAQEAVISTPDGNPTDGINSQRLVINPGQGYGSGEGGDIYLWAGRGGPTDGSGGDVKIRGGQGMADGTGGYIRIEGGDTQGAGYPGYIDIKGGQGGTTQGAYVRITGGQGATNGGEAGVIGGYGTDVGGDANITAGYGGTNQGGNVNITGGGSALGLPGYGNVNVNAGASQWVFNNTGVLTAPGAISAVGNVIGGNITTGGIANLNSVRMSQSISWPDYSGSEIYEDGGLVINGPGGVYATGNIAARFEFNDGLGNSSGLYSDIGNSLVYSVGNVIVRSNNLSQTDWTFDTTGNLNLPQGGWIGAAGVKGDGTMLTGGTGQIASLTSFYADAPGVYSSCVTVNPDGTLNITTYGNGTGVLGQWVFTGANLTVPGNSVVSTPNAESGLGGNSISIVAGAADQFNFNAYAGGNLNLTGGLGGFNDDGIGGPGGNVNISAGSPGEPGGHAGNVTINAGTNTWTFDYTGNVAVPGNLNYEGVASPAPSINGFDSVNVITVNATGNISATGNVTAGNVYANNIVAEAPFIVIATNFEANIGGRYGVDTTGGTVTATLSNTPPTGGAVFFADAGGAYSSNNLIIDPNGGTIMGATGNMTVSTPNQSVGLFYNGTTWRIYNAG